MCVVLYDLSTGVCCSQNADVIKSHPHILANISDHLFGVMEGFINTRYSMHSMMYEDRIFNPNLAVNLTLVQGSSCHRENTSC